MKQDIDVNGLTSVLSEMTDEMNDIVAKTEALRERLLNTVTVLKNTTNAGKSNSDDMDINALVSAEMGRINAAPLDGPGTEQPKYPLDPVATEGQHIVHGITGPAKVTVDGPFEAEISINGGPFLRGPLTVRAGDLVAWRPVDALPSAPPKTRRPRMTNGKYYAFESPQRRDRYLAQAVAEGATRVDLALEMGVDESTIRKALQRHRLHQALVAAHEAEQIQDGDRIPMPALTAGPEVGDVRSATVEIRPPIPESEWQPITFHVPAEDDGPEATVDVYLPDKIAFADLEEPVEEPGSFPEGEVLERYEAPVIRDHEAVNVLDDRPARLDPLSDDHGEGSVFQKEPHHLFALDPLDRRIRGSRGVVTVGPSLFRAMKVLSDGKVHPLGKLANAAQWMGQRVLEDRLDRLGGMLAHAGIMLYKNYDHGVNVTYHVTA